MSCPTGVLLLHALQQLKLDLSVEELSTLYTSCVLQVRREVWLARLDPVLWRSAHIKLMTSPHGVG